MGDFLYVPPYRQRSLFGTVTAATIDSDHEAGALVDGIPGVPMRLTAPNGSFSIAQTAASVGIIAVCHHLLDAGSVVTLGGDLSGTLTAPALPRNGVPLNFARLQTPEVTCDNVTFAISGNGVDDLIGELILGAPLVLDPAPRIVGSQFRERSYVGPRASELAAHPGYSDRAKSRPFSASLFCSQDGLDDLFEWFDGQDGNAYQVPSLIVPDDDDLTDVRLVFLSEPQYVVNGPEGSDTRWLVDLEFTEVPRTRW